MNLLEKGLNFSPQATGIEKQNYMKDIDTFRRSLLLKVFFKDDGSKEYISTTLEKIARKENKNPFQPPGVTSIDAYTEAIKDEVKHAYTQKVKDNLSPHERDALMRLSKNRDIAIKQADKGGATVVMDASAYKQEAMRQLNNTTFYHKLEENRTMMHEELVRQKFQELKSSEKITPEEAKMMSPDESRTPEFYTQPKIHKETIPVQIIPVISSCGCSTEKISAYQINHKEIL